MSDDLVCRLRALSRHENADHSIGNEAADEIERLRNQVAAGVAVVNLGVHLMTDEQVGSWAGVRSWLEQETEDYEVGT